MKKFILLIALSALFYSVPGHADQERKKLAKQAAQRYKARKAAAREKAAAPARLQASVTNLETQAATSCKRLVTALQAWAKKTGEASAKVSAAEDHIDVRSLYNPLLWLSDEQRGPKNEGDTQEEYKIAHNIDNIAQYVYGSTDLAQEKVVRIVELLATSAPEEEAAAVEAAAWEEAAEEAAEEAEEAAEAKAAAEREEARDARLVAHTALFRAAPPPEEEAEEAAAWEEAAEEAEEEAEEAAAPVAAAPVPQEAPPAPLEAQVEQAEEAWNLLYAQLEAVIKEWDEANALMAQLNAQFEDEDTKRATVNEEWESLHAQTTAAVEETDNAQAAWEQAKANAETKKVDEPEEYPAASAQTEDALKRWNDADAETARVYALAGDAYAQREACALDNKTEECEAAHEKWKKLKAQWEDAAAEVYNDAELLRVQEAQTAQEEEAEEAWREAWWEREAWEARLAAQIASYRAAAAAAPVVIVDPRCLGNRKIESSML